jgi:hypothetical protein
MERPSSMTNHPRRRHEDFAATSGMPESSSSGDATAVRARAKLRKLWQEGDPFHLVTRYPRKKAAPRIDRLVAILGSGLVAPARSAGTVVSDLNLPVLDCEPAYEDFIFLHRFGPKSWLYTMSEPGRFTVFIDPQFPVLTPEHGSDSSGARLRLPSERPLLRAVPCSRWLSHGLMIHVATWTTERNRASFLSAAACSRTLRKRAVSVSAWQRGWPRPSVRRERNRASREREIRRLAAAWTSTTAAG